MSGLRDVTAFCALGWFWGTTFAAVEVGLVSFPPLLLLALRYYIAGAILLGYVAWTTDDWRPATTADFVAISGGGLFWIAIGNGVWFVGQELTTSVLSGLMTALIPIATTAFSWVLLPEDRLTPLSLVGLCASFGGALLIVSPSGTAVAAVSAELVGKGLLVAGVAGSALGSVLIRRAAAPISSTAQTAWAVLLGAVVIHGLHRVTGEPGIATVTMDSVAALLYLSVPATVVAYRLFFSLLDRHSAIEITLVTYLVPIVATSTGWLLFAEPVTKNMLVGFPIVLVGFGLMKRRELRAEFARFRNSG